MLTCVLTFAPNFRKDAIDLVTKGVDECIKRIEAGDGPRVIALPEGVRAEFVDVPVADKE